MRYGVYIKAAKEMLDDQPTFTAYIKHNNDYYKKKQLKRSVRLINGRVQIGEEFDDFVKNLVTVMTIFDAYKIPRFLKKHLLR